MFKKQYTYDLFIQFKRNKILWNIKNNFFLYYWFIYAILLILNILVSNYIYCLKIVFNKRQINNCVPFQNDKVILLKLTYKF